MPEGALSPLTKVTLRGLVDDRHAARVDSAIGHRLGGADLQILIIRRRIAAGMVPSI
jgi:hypothetical protein